MFYAYYEKTTGRLVSTGTVPSKRTKSNLTRVEYPDGFPKDKFWNEETKEFDIDIPASKSITVQGFARLFTQDERRSIKRLSLSDERLDDFLTTSQIGNSIDVLSDDVQADLDYLVLKGIISSARKSEIENG